MFDALYIGATGMQAQQLNVDTIANNLANINTTGFKKSRVSFTDLVALESSRVGPGLPLDVAQNAGPLASLQGIGSGVGVSDVARLFDAGGITPTGSAWDVAVQGDGFIQVTLPDGSTVFSRGGTLKVNSDGLLATKSGEVIKPGISIPANATSVTIAADGSVAVTVPNQGAPLQAGQIQLARFANPGALQSLGDNLYRPSAASGEPMAAGAGQDGAGTLKQGYVEGSNVKMVDEMVNLMVAQRAYEANVKIVQASDELLGMVNNLRK
jgi:flagellar basal-body rod protein FlgG